jgi:hypothetical protein
MSKKLMIISCLVNVDDLSVEQANDSTYHLSSHIYKILKNDEYDVRCIVLPVVKQPTEIKIIYPKYIGNNDNFYNWFDKFLGKIVKTTDSFGAPIINSEIDLLINEYMDLRNNFDDTGEMDMKIVMTKLDQIKEMLNDNKNFEEQIKNN